MTRSDPFVPDDGAVRSPTGVEKVPGEFHFPAAA